MDTKNQMKNSFKLAIFILFISGCAVSPGMSEPENSFFGDNSSIMIDGKLVPIEIIDIDKKFIEEQNVNNEVLPYKVEIGDVLTFTVWGLEDVFPMNYNQYNSPQNARTVGSDGKIFFPYVGELLVQNLTVDEIRETITNLLNQEFNNPQLDVTITRYNETRKIYVIGELTQPQVIRIGLDRISLLDAIGTSKGISVTSASGDKVYITRFIKETKDLKVYRADLSTSLHLSALSEFYLEPRDVVFVGAASITKWNRFIGQLFPFASFLNQVDNIKD